MADTIESLRARVEALRAALEEIENAPDPASMFDLAHEALHHDQKVPGCPCDECTGSRAWEVR